MSIVYDYPYNRRIAEKLSKYNYIWEPMQTSTFSRQRSGGAMYAQAGSSATYPMLDMVSQEIYDRGRASKGEAIMKVRPVKPSSIPPMPSRPVAPSQKKGGAKRARKPTHKQLAHEIVNALNNKKGGAFNFESDDVFGEIKKIATPYIKKGISLGLNIVVPTLGKEVGKLFGGEEGKIVGGLVGQLARDLIKKKTGYAREMDGGKINLGKLKKKAKQYKPYISAGLDAGIPAGVGALGTLLGPEATIPSAIAGQVLREGLRQQTGWGRNCKDVGVYKGGAKPKVSSGRNKRNEIVKKVMREKGLSLPQASRYVKENNLY